MNNMKEEPERKWISERMLLSIFSTIDTYDCPSYYNPIVLCMLYLNKEYACEGKITSLERNGQRVNNFSKTQIRILN